MVALFMGGLANMPDSSQQAKHRNSLEGVQSFTVKRLVTMTDEDNQKVDHPSRSQNALSQQTTQAFYVKSLTVAASKEAEDLIESAKSQDAAAITKTAMAGATDANTEQKLIVFKPSKIKSVKTVVKSSQSNQKNQEVNSGRLSLVLPATRRAKKSRHIDSSEAPSEFTEILQAQSPRHAESAYQQKPLQRLEDYG